MLQKNEFIQPDFSPFQLIMKKITCILLMIIVLQNMQAQKKEYVFATYTYSSNNRLQNLEPLAKYLSEKAGVKIKAVSYPTVQALISALVNDSVDFAMMNTSGYLVLQKKHPGIVLPLVNLDMGSTAQTNYGGCLIASKQYGIQSISAIGKQSQPLSLALVNTSSTSGNLMPRLMLNERGITSAEEKFNVYYAGTHKKVVEDVLSGKAQLGGCGCAEVDSAKQNLKFDEKAVIISAYNNIPLGPVVYNRNLSEQFAQAISLLLINLHTENNAVFTNFCNGWTEFKQAIQFKTVQDSAYNNFRSMFGTNLSLWKLIE
jgi:phosphonate transport system substrate-binding protein